VRLIQSYGADSKIGATVDEEPEDRDDSMKVFSLHRTRVPARDVALHLVMTISRLGRSG
jgi:hypothetical protein